MLRAVLIAVLAGFGCLLGEARAAVWTQSAVYTENGATLTFAFEDVTATGPVVLTLSSGSPAFFTGSQGTGFDLDDTSEWFDLSLDEHAMGRFNCGGGDGVTVIDDHDASGPFGGLDCAFVLTLDVARDMLVDGALVVTVAFSRNVHHFDEGDRLFARLEATATPLPGALGLFAIGAAALGLLRRSRAA